MNKNLTNPLNSPNMPASAQDFAAEFDFAAAVFEHLRAQPHTRAIKALDSKSAQQIADVAPFFGLEPVILPDIRAQKGDEAVYFADELAILAALLHTSAKEKNALIIAPIATCELEIFPLAAPLELEFAQRFCGGVEGLKNWLLRANYKPASTVLDVGEFCVNGDKIDVYPPNCEPLRIVFFDEDIESIREFEIESQLSAQEELPSAQIVPLFGELFGSARRLDEEFCFANLAPASTFSSFKPLLSQQFFDANADKKITLIASNKSKYAGLNLGENTQIVQNNAYFCIKSAQELIVSLNTRSIKKLKKQKIRLDINAICAGDYVVHERYGIGKFVGLELVKMGEISAECVRLEYASGNILLLPMTAIGLLEPYAASSTPQLDSLGKSSFIKLKAKLESKLFAIAEQIAQLAAKRVLIKAPILKKPPNYEQFAAAAGFMLTQDQESAVDEIFKDFARGYPMDRLLAADVGFGKTEVAMHAAYAAAYAGYKCLFLAPTTLLCAQHFATLTARFEPFGAAILRCDSTVKKAAFIKQLNELKNSGAIIVGTHSLLSANVDNIGLIVVDEEHKFGVKQKEKLKELATQAHCLFMSATPIPRTLWGALSSLKSYSQINTPPNERIGVSSKLAEQDDALIKEVILRELRRGGQVFYIHNRLASQTAKAAYLQKLLPHLKIALLSSQTKAAEKEQILKDFLAAKYDLLLSTSIVESGLDMPRANTIIIERADLFGVADLHQLRGRVGRGSRQGFCYFLYEGELADTAKERLISLASNSYLGAGAALAQMDLQLRGGGNLLGEQQSGHIEALGYGLYVRMLEEQLNKLSQSGEKECECELALQVSAYLSSEQIADDGVRLEFYSRLASAKTAYELGKIEDEFSDRFSQPEGASALYFALMRLKIAANNAKVRRLSSYESNIKIEFFSGENRVIKAPSAADEDVIYAAMRELNNAAILG